MSISKTWCVILLVFASGCSSVFYQPTDVMYVDDPSQLDGLRKEIEIPTSEGKKLAAWWFAARKNGRKGVVVQFHGNAQNMTSHFASLFWLIDQGYDLVTFDYRGYGISEGKPSQEGLNIDAQSAIRFVLSDDRWKGVPVVLYGQSLGGAVLLRAYDGVTPAERSRVKAMVIESSFYNYKSIARNVLGRSWVTFLLQPLAYVLVSNSYSPEDVIEGVSPTPLLVIHGDADPVVPVQYGKKIYELARDPKELWIVSGGGHINSMASTDSPYRKKLCEFLNKQSNFLAR